MPAMSAEKKLSQAMQNGLGQIDFEPAMVVLDYDRRNSDMQSRMMDLIMGFLSNWQARYRAGIFRPGEKMYRIGEMSDIMLSALHCDSTGRHCAIEE